MAYYRTIDTTKRPFSKYEWKKLVNWINAGNDFSKIDWFYYFGVCECGKYTILKQAFGERPQPECSGEEAIIDDKYQLDVAKLISNEIKSEKNYNYDNWERLENNADEKHKAEPFIDSLIARIEDAELQFYKKEVDKQTEQSEPGQKVEPQRIELGSIHTKVHGKLKYLESNHTLIKNIYNYLISTESIDTDVEWQYFILSIRRADLGEIYSSPKTKKSNFLYAVGVINQNMEHGWLEDVLSSMNINKSKFGGKHPTTYFVHGFPRK